MDKSSAIVQAIIGVSIAIVIFAMVLLPMVESSVNSTIDGDEETLTNTTTNYFAPYDGESDITLTFDGTNVTNTSSYTDIVTATQYINIDSNTITIWSSTGKAVVTSDTFTLTLTPAQIVLVDSTSEGATYGMWTSLTDLYVKNNAALYVYNDAKFVSEGYNGTGIALTTDETDYKDVYEVTAIAGEHGGIFAPLTVTYYEQIPAMDDNIKAILEIVPILVIIGILLACTYMFIGNGRRA